jgi:F-type H+-transporting ATPase subunit a
MMLLSPRVLGDTTETVDFDYKIAHMFDWEADAALYSLLIIILILIIVCIAIFIRFTVAYKKKEYLNRPKGLILWAEYYEEWAEGFVGENMGKDLSYFTPYFMFLTAYLFLGFIFGVTGLPSVIDWLAAPLCLSIIMFILIHATAIRYQHWAYFKRYVDPFAIFLPVNLITMWSPIISTSMRMFGNCLAGTIIIGIVQWALSSASGAMFGALTSIAESNYFPSWDVDQSTVWTEIFLAPIPIGVLNLYFSLFSGYIQTTVFIYLNALWIAQERPTEEDEGVVTEKKPSGLVEAR